MSFFILLLYVVVGGIMMFREESWIFLFGMAMYVILDYVGKLIEDEIEDWRRK